MPATNQASGPRFPGQEQPVPRPRDDAMVPNERRRDNLLASAQGLPMGLINWIFDFYQHSRINDARDEATKLRTEIAALRGDRSGPADDRMLRAIGELALAVKTVQRLCVEKGLCTEAEFQRRAQSIDLEDGRADGMAAPR